MINLNTATNEEIEDYRNKINVAIHKRKQSIKRLEKELSNLDALKAKPKKMYRGREVK